MVGGQGLGLSSLEFRVRVWSLECLGSKVWELRRR